MRYQELLRLHSYLFQRRPKDIPRDAAGLGLLEIHTSLPTPPAALRFVSHFDETPAKQAVKLDDQLARSGIGETIRPEAFPNTGYLGEGLK